jgi:ABC-type transporter Mla subunit MlaD
MTDDEIRLNLESLHASTHELYEAVQRHDAQLAQLVESANATREAVQRHDGQLAQLITIANTALESIQSLERIATAHQQRLDDQDGRIERLEDQGPG